MASQRMLVGGGRLTMEETGGGVRFYASRPLDGRGLYKVWICGGGGRMLLGTMVPEGNLLQLSRTVSRGVLVGNGCYPVTGGEVVMAFPFQQRGESPKKETMPQGWQQGSGVETKFDDPLLKESIKELNCLTRQEEGEFLLAVRHQEGSEFPLLPLFCLARWHLLEGKGYLMWKFDERGRPILWNKP